MECERQAVAVVRRKAAIFVDRSHQQWVVQDPDGGLWVVLAGEDSWSQRRPFEWTDETRLEPVPAHYQHMLGLTFQTESKGSHERRVTASRGSGVGGVSVEEVGAVSQ